MIHFTILDTRYTQEALGFIPDFLLEDDPLPAVEQFNYRYAHGGGWLRFDGFAFGGLDAPSLKYPGDPAMQPIARGTLREETIFVYPSAWVAIVQPNGDYEVSRMD